MSRKAIRRIAIILIAVVPFIYTGFWLYKDIPPRFTPNIDYFKTKNLKDFSDEEMTNMWEAYEKSSFIRKVCFKKYLDARDYVLLKYCLDNDLGKNIGGGCYHFVGSYNSNDTYHALRYCGISWNK